MGLVLEHNLGAERIIAAFESGWQAGASFGGAQLGQFSAVGPDLQLFWLDGFYAAQAHIGPFGSATVEAGDDHAVWDEADRGAAEDRPWHAITRALHAAYKMAGGPPSHDSISAVLTQLDLIP